MDVPRLNAMEQQIAQQQAKIELLTEQINGLNWQIEKLSERWVNESGCRRREAERE